MRPPVTGGRVARVRLEPSRVNIVPLLERQRFRFPAVLVDAVSPDGADHLRATKLVGVSEEFVQGHFPGVPLLPGVLMLEALTQAASLLLLDRDDTPPAARVVLRGVDDVKFRRQVVPGDRLALDVRLARRRGPIARVHAAADVDGQVVVEARAGAGPHHRRAAASIGPRRCIPGRSSAPAPWSGRTPSSARTSCSAAAS